MADNRIKKARKSLNSAGLDYRHGTGHGVGYFLNVHEGPQSISKFNRVKFEEGMILSNEPGYYKEGKFGIRIENLVYVKRLNFIIFHISLYTSVLAKEYNRAAGPNYLFLRHCNVCRFLPGLGLVAC